MQLEGFDDFKKIAGIAIVLVIGVVAIGITHSVTSRIYQEYQESAAKSHALAATFDELHHHLESAENSAERFFTTGNLEHFENFNETIATLKAETEEISQRTDLSESEKEQVTLQAQVYQNLDNLVSNRAHVFIEFGLDYSSGLQGEVNSAALELQSVLNDQLDLYKGNTRTLTELNQLLISTLKMREHEKTFLSSQDDIFVENLSAERVIFTELLDRKVLNPEVTEQLQTLVNKYFQTFLVLVEAQHSLVEEEKKINEELATIGTLSDAIVASVEEQASERNAELVKQSNAVSKVFYSVLGLVLIAMLGSLVFLGRNLFKAMIDLRQSLNERADDLRKQEQRADEISDSVVQLMEAAERLSKQDLTVTVPVSEDITGAVSDALNLMTRSTAETIWRIMQISQRLEQATITVKGQNDKVTSVAANEKLVVSDTLNTLEASSTTMSTMASLANECHALADHATTSTHNALEAVQQAVSSMLAIRGTVHESEKSIKRLGERSKEIGSIVEIIKDIAERTHTLALNAGMQAVAAGEAGRGFSVVADEVQRLAEMARESTGQITTLVKSIQSESSESMDIMNKAIGQVVEGSQKADNASNAMQSTGEAATTLAQAVNRLVEQSQKQETFNQGLSGLANQLRISSDATEEELTAQAEEMKKMLSYMKYLVQSVNVFKLPAQKKSA